MDPLLNDDLQRQLMALFLVEAQEHIQRINQNLILLEGLPLDAFDAQVLAETLRETHSLKGAAQAVELNEIGKLAHHLESLFVRLQNTRKNLSKAGFDLVYRAFDVIENYVKAISSSEPMELDTSILVGEIEALITEYPVQTDQKIENNSRGEEISARKITPDLLPAVENNRPVSPKKSKNKKVEVKKDQINRPGPEIITGNEKKPEKSPLPTGKNDETIRLTTGKLDTLLSMMGELQVTRLGVMQNLIELQEIKETINVWETDWRKVQPAFRRQLNLQKTNITNIKVNNPGLSSPLFDFLQENESHLHHLRDKLNHLIRTFDHDNRRLEQISHAMEEEIHKTRMLPVSTVFNTYNRMVRDLAYEKGKEAGLVIEGGEINVDRSVLEQIKDPLLHLLRNCIDHGIEPPDERSKAGKARKGTITLRASHQGDSLMLEIMDDGAGVDLEGVRMTAVKRQILSEETARGLSDRDALWLIFNSGFSTSPIVTNTSGRGVGLDVVREQVECLHGLIDVENAPGKGVKFILTVPLTVATTLCLVVKTGSWKFGSVGQAFTYAIPITNVIRMLRINQADIHAVEGCQVIKLNDEPILLRRLAEVLELNNQTTDNAAGEKQPVIVVGATEKRMAFIVDQVIFAQELVLKSLPYPLLRMQNITGASITGSGEIIPVLNISGLINIAENKKMQNNALLADSVETRVKNPVIMVADDSITTRTLEKNILEAAGYDVHSAFDGMDAWTQMQLETFDLLISDVVMPRLNGFELTKKIREDEHYQHLPVILITSLDSTNEREQGIRAGADAYIVKSAFDQQALLDTIKRLL
ncbi:MAG: hybrid sensor histidine kinase/response regulator [Anaerolineae bacterium]|nr:hybrid sensor histidine kinase/response regulator [Anaerolineae bacterium]